MGLLYTCSKKLRNWYNIAYLWRSFCAVEYALLLLRLQNICSVVTSLMFSVQTHMLVWRYFSPSFDQASWKWPKHVCLPVLLEWAQTVTTGIILYFCSNTSGIHGPWIHWHIWRIGVHINNACSVITFALTVKTLSIGTDSAYNYTARQCSPLRRKFMECYIIKPAQSLFMKHLVIGQR